MATSGSLSSSSIDSESSSSTELDSSSSTHSSLNFEKEEETNAFINLRLGSCEVCSSKQAIYTCPRCEFKTCSLECCKNHKAKLNCNGQRNKTKYVPLQSFDNLTLVSDYRLLEEVNRTIKKPMPSSYPYKTKGRFHTLKREADARGIKLKYFPDVFQRHKDNTSYYDVVVKRIVWHVELVFDNAEIASRFTEQVPENEKVSSFLDKYLRGQHNNKVVAKQLEFYESAGASGVKVLLDAGKGKFCYEIDPFYTLGECLKKKTVLEHPIFHVVLRNHSCGYQIIDSDEEEEEEKNSLPTAQLPKSANGLQVVNKIIRTENNSSCKKRINYLFETSDDD